MKLRGREEQSLWIEVMRARLAEGVRPGQATEDADVVVRAYQERVVKEEGLVEEFPLLELEREELERIRGQIRAESARLRGKGKE